MARLQFETVTRAMDANGNPLSGAKKYVYLAGTTTAASTFSDEAMAAAQANPQISDANGYFAGVYLEEGDYKIVVTDASDNTLWEADNIKVVFDEALPAIMLAAFGQSNIESSNSQANGGSLVSDEKIQYWNGSDWVTWTPSTGMGVGAAGRNSILFQAAKEAVRAGYPKVYCVVDGHAGQAISYWTGSGTSSSGYVSLKAQMDAAIASSTITSAGISTLHGLIWGQGESDGGASFVMTNYQTSFETLKTQLRAEAWMATSTPIACLEMPSLSSAQTVNRYFISELPFDDDPYTCTVKTEGLDDGTDNLHWTGAAMDEIGPRCFKEIEQSIFPSLPHPYRVDADAVHFRLEEVNGKGLGISYSDGAEQIQLGSTSDALFPSIAAPVMTFDIDGAFLRFDHYTYALSTFEFLAGAVLKSYTQANFEDIGHAVNTDSDKKAGMIYRDDTNNRLVVANGTGASGTWSYFAATGTYTPV